jgi:hypothetical protein
MYATLLTIHSVVRWLVIVSALAAYVAALRGAAAPGGRTARLAGFALATFFDVQLIVGLLLYLRFSPLTTTAIHHFDRAMGNDVVRFWAVEHPVGMLAGLALVHIGNVKIRRNPADPRALRRTAIYFALALVIVLLSVPRPFMPYGRPLL